LSLALVSPALAQSTAINGTIEGTIKDEQGAVLPGVTVTVSNVDTGDQRVVVTNESGLYRAPLLSLGTYQVVVELQGFKKVERTGISLRAGQTAVIDFALTVGAVVETITVTADSPLVDLAVAREAKPRLWVAAALVAVFAIFHGHAHGTELPAGQSGLAYSIGFVIATGCLHGVGITIGLIHRWPFGRKVLQVAGAAVALAGVMFMWRALA
jgi:hypothetical protein